MRSELAPVIVGLLIIVSVVSSISMSAQSVGFRVVEGWCVDVPSVNGWVSVAAVDNDSFYAAEYGDVGDGNVLVVVKVVNGSVVWSRVLYRDSEGYLITSAVNGSSGRLWVALYNSSALVICGSGYCYKFSNLTITTGYGVLSVYGRYVVVGVWDKLFVFDTVSGVIKEYGIGMYVDSIMSNIMTVSNLTHCRDLRC